MRFLIRSFFITEFYRVYVPYSLMMAQSSTERLLRVAVDLVGDGAVGVVVDEALVPVEVQVVPLVRHSGIHQMVA